MRWPRARSASTSAGAIVFSQSTDKCVACDTVVFTGDWIPDHELARGADLAMDPGTRGPVVDASGRTSQAGVFAAGNLVHAAEPADVAGLGGRAAAAAIGTFLTTGAWPAARVTMACEPPLRWVWPQALAPAAPPPAALLVRTNELVRAATIVAEQDARILWRSRPRTLVPNRSIRVPAAWTTAVAPEGGPVGWRLD